MEGTLFILTLVAALGAGLNAGILYAFSSFVMTALGRLPPAQSVAAMQSINVVAVTPPFMAAFFGTALACLALMVVALFELDEPYAGWLIGGGALYLVGTIGLTIGYHVPRNNALAAVDPTSPQAESAWGRYLKEWTAWNHVRVAAALAAAAAFTIALTVD
jgi:uncharacterized membrane protein